MNQRRKSCRPQKTPNEYPQNSEFNIQKSFNDCGIRNKKLLRLFVMLAALSTNDVRISTVSSEGLSQGIQFKFLTRRGWEEGTSIWFQGIMPLPGAPSFHHKGFFSKPSFSGLEMNDSHSKSLSSQCDVIFMSASLQ
jgi:hypothetical protein